MQILSHSIRYTRGRLPTYHAMPRVHPPAQKNQRPHCAQKNEDRYRIKIPKGFDNSTVDRKLNKPSPTLFTINAD